MEAHQTKILQFQLETPLTLKKGGVLKEIEIAYETHGELNSKKDNVVLVCHPLTMDAHLTNNDSPNIQPGWWNYFVGPGKAIDTNLFHVICFNVLGGCKGSTGPISINPETGQSWKTDLPIITVQDMVKVQKIGLDHLGIQQLSAIVGGSLGGMQAIEWSVSYPGFAKRIVAMATGASLSPQGLAFDIIGRQAITSDPDWKGGTYAPEEAKSITGLKVARMIGHITYISRAAMDRKFGRNLQTGMGENAFNTSFAVESFLQYQGDKFAERFDPNSYLYISKAMDLYDLAEGYESLEDSLARSQSRYLIISYSSDWLFPPQKSLDLISALTSNGRHVTYANIKTDLGHDAFLVDSPDKAQDRLVKPFLEQDR